MDVSEKAQKNIDIIIALLSGLKFTENAKIVIIWKIRTFSVFTFQFGHLRVSWWFSLKSFQSCIFHQSVKVKKILRAFVSTNEVTKHTIFPSMKPSVFSKHLSHPFLRKCSIDIVKSEQSGWLADDEIIRKICFNSKRPRRFCLLIPREC